MEDPGLKEFVVAVAMVMLTVAGIYAVMTLTGCDVPMDIHSVRSLS